MATAFNTWRLPGELLDAILARLEPRDLANVSQVCKHLHERANADHWWIRAIQRNLPPFTRPLQETPLPPHIHSYRDLYVAHEARWFLPRHKIWISGSDMLGKVILVRYDPRRGCIEGYQLLAINESKDEPLVQWPSVQPFKPVVSVHLDRPVIKLEARLPAPSDVAVETEDEREDRGMGQGKGKGNETAEDPAPNSTEGAASASALADVGGPPLQKKPKITLAAQPTGTYFTWDSYARAISTETPAIGPICPRIRPIDMDLDGGGRSVPGAIRICRQFLFGRPLVRDVAVHTGLSVDQSPIPPTIRFAAAGTTIGMPGRDDVDGHYDDFGAWRRYRPGRTTRPFPQYSIWPPPELPAPHRVRAVETYYHYPRGPIGQPRLRSDVSERAFHVRSWIDPLAGTPWVLSENASRLPTPTVADLASTTPVPVVSTPASVAGPSTATPTATTTTAQVAAPPGVLPNSPAGGLTGPLPTEAFNGPTRPMFANDKLETFATIDPHYYTPTKDRPFRGIFVGDYSSHGCEFLLVYQSDDVIKLPVPRRAHPNDGEGSANGDSSDSIDSDSGSPGSFPDREPPTATAAAADAEVSVRFTGESDADFAQRVSDHRTYRGSIRAIKLTGDSNVPRGEVSFIAPDLGPDGLVRVMTEEPFEGVRMVNSRGHIAGARFVNDRWTDTQLLLISKDRLAMHWVAFGHVNYFERVDIDRYLDPLSP